MNPLTTIPELGVMVGFGLLWTILLVVACLWGYEKLAVLMLVATVAMAAALTLLAWMMPLL
jgi:hypothetical protein